MPLLLMVPAWLPQQQQGAAGCRGQGRGVRHTGRQALALLPAGRRPDSKPWQQQGRQGQVQAQQKQQNWRNRQRLQKQHCRGPLTSARRLHRSRWRRSCRLAWKQQAQRMPRDAR